MARTVEQAPLMEQREVSYKEVQHGELSDDSLETSASQFFDSSDVSVTLQEVFRDELELIQEKFEKQAQDGTVKEVPPGEKFALAFSGGGIRAAAFQAGVLWRLAQMGRLKDVEMLTAVSGGGYIASSYLSHLAHTEKPREGENLDDWYRKVVAATIVRMQANQGAFVRDLGKESTGPGGCASWVPRLCDCPAMILMTCFTMLINPLLFLFFSVPLIETIEVFFGAAMRAAFCHARVHGMTDTLLDWGYPWYHYLLYTCVVLFTLAVIFNVISGVLVKQGTRVPGEKHIQASTCWQIVNAITCFLNRMTIMFAALVFFIYMIIQLMRHSYMLEEAIHPGSNQAGQFCAAYTSKLANDTSSFYECADDLNGTYWFQRPEFQNVTYQSVNKAQHPTSLYKWFVGVLRYWFGDEAPDICGIVSFFLFVMLLLSSVCLFFLPSLMSITISIIGPAFIFLFLADLVKFRVYGNLVHAELFGFIQFDQDLWNTFSVYSIFLAIAFIPFYQIFRAVMHNYYRRILMNNYYCGGQDTKLFAFKDQIYSPFFLLMGTASDFCRVGDNSPNAATTEMSFSPLHFGSEKTGYIQTPEFFALSRAAALSGAGGMDAIGLGLNDQLSMRFWTEALNLTWGDYVLFQESRIAGVGKLARFLACVGCEKELAWFLLRVPSMTVWVAMFIVFAIGGYDNIRFEDGDSCKVARMAFLGGYAIFWVYAFLSFFWFIPCVSMLVSFSPITRVCHQVTRYYYTGNNPPPMLYITDGGAFDCTTLTQLVIRKTRRILMVLAAMDPDDELGVLKTAMHACVNDKLCSFYDPEHPDRDYMVYLDAFKENKNMPFMHMGITYGWGKTLEHGTLIIVKNRLRPECRPWPISPWLTEEEILGGEAPPFDEDFDTSGFDFDEEAWEELGEADSEYPGAEALGGMLCCDSAHLRGCNAGTKWPQLTGANYLWLSPMLFNELCRLGHSESAVPAELIGRPQHFFPRGN